MNELSRVAENLTPLEQERFADQTTPLIRDCWYVAGFSDEISREIISRRLLGIDIAMYRTVSGEPVAVRNRCPHRSFPLAKGRLDGDTLICGYHGMQFDPSGRCVTMPSMPIVPSNANVLAFPMAERGPIVWIWMGDADHADEDLIPDTSWLADAGWKSVRGQFRIKTDYVSMHENLLDQTHFPFLHPGTVGTPEYARSKLDVRRVGDVVIIDRALRDAAPPGIYGVPMQLMDRKVDRFSEARFASPAIHTAFASVVDRTGAEGPETYRFNITHLITPETNESIHYWWFNSRDRRLDDPTADEFLLVASEQAYLEDVEALEWILEAVTTDVEPQFDLNFAPDKPGLLMRRILFEAAGAAKKA
ncbi:aromatic ring-hydroxylating dioxygenase subunit alpha [Sphingomonas bisphenolicum]|uniref:Oxidoreductase subunit alpha n=1 Tax=Sphingomonas bisphenolicum TaxID=296544 RepID=A0ABM7G8L7_9SPHN|nr:aromatic ring-hydroxylating dioxygenase subunit alpha [Sphingomonas bisphenolicum]BBF72018.1 oxidoreductase subunit alpha [Sphingomonas bisphenolicum]